MFFTPAITNIAASVISSNCLLLALILMPVLPESEQFRFVAFTCTGVLLQCKYLPEIENSFICDNVSGLSFLTHGTVYLQILIRLLEILV